MPELQPQATGQIIQSFQFKHVIFNPIYQNGEPLFLARQIGEALGYAQPGKVINLFNRNKDEFSASMSLILEMRMGDGAAPTPVRLFSLRGCHLLAMLSKTNVAKEFRHWVLDVLESNNTGTEQLQLDTPSIRKTGSYSIPQPPVQPELPGPVVIDWRDVSEHYYKDKLIRLKQKPLTNAKINGIVTPDLKSLILRKMSRIISSFLFLKANVKVYGVCVISPRVNKQAGSIPVLNSIHHF